MSIWFLLAQPFAQHALLAAALVAVTCGLIGPTGRPQRNVLRHARHRRTCLHRRRRRPADRTRHDQGGAGPQMAAGGRADCRLGFDYGYLLAALRAAGASPRPSLALLAYSAAGIVALFPIYPGRLGIVEASLSGLLILAASAPAMQSWPPLLTGSPPTGSRCWPGCRPTCCSVRRVVSVRRLGAGGIFSALRTRLIVDAQTRWPSLSSSPWILLYPQPLFSAASRSMSAATSALTGGLPVRFG